MIRLVRAVFAGIGAFYDTLIPGPNVAGYRLDMPNPMCPTCSHVANSECPDAWHALNTPVASAAADGATCELCNHWLHFDNPCAACLCGSQTSAASAELRTDVAVVPPPAAFTDPAGVLPAPAGSPSPCFWCGEDTYVMPNDDGSAYLVCGARGVTKLVEPTK